VKAVRLALDDQSAFSVLRPPGHHATRERAMGFCYLGSVALAALEAKASGVKRIAILDFDVHHGNGTEDLLRDTDGVTFVSVHQSPCYPGTGTGHVGSNCFNYPVAPNTPREDWRKVLQQGLARVREAAPDLVGISAGFDAYAMDPLANGTLSREDFHWLGQEIRRLNCPTFHVLEGGYSVDLPDLILHYLLGFAGKSV
jgi:acetoin utilization deacetylase AcuC-like enzyme